MIDKRADGFDIEANITHCDISYRGGVLKVDVSSLFPELYPGIEKVVMGASQNYLGGGIAGRITSSASFSPALLSKRDQKTFQVLAERIKKYFHELNGGGGDEHMQENYGEYGFNQNLPVSVLELY